MPRHINIYAIDINRDDDCFTLYDTAPFDIKLSCITGAIHKIMTDPNAKDHTVIIGWREYGLTESKSKFVSVAQKNELKKTMLSLTAQYPNLIIIAGTVAVKKHFKQLSVELQKSIQSDYASIKNQHSLTSDREIEFNLHKASWIKERASDDGVHIIRNSCFVFHGSSFQRYDKSLPHYETDDNGTELNNGVFRPSKAKTANPIVTIMIDGEPLRIGLEICRDHGYGVLKTRLAQSNTSNPDLHCIVSDRALIDPAFLCADHTIQFDSESKPKLLVSREGLEKNNVTLFEHNILREGHVRGPLAPIHAFERTLINILEKKLNEDQLSDSQRELIEIMRKEIINSMFKYDRKITYQCVKAQIEKYKTAQSYRRLIANFSSPYYTHSATLFNKNQGQPDQSFLQDLENIAKAAMASSFDIVDYTSRYPTKEISVDSLKVLSK